MVDDDSSVGVEITDRRATVTAAIADATVEDEVNLAIIHAQLNEAFGLDLGAGFLVDAEVETVATTCTDSSCPSRGGDEENPSANDNANRTYAVDPSTGVSLPVATPVRLEPRGMEDDYCASDWKPITCILVVFIGGVVGFLIFFLA